MKGRILLWIGLLFFLVISCRPKSETPDQTIEESAIPFQFSDDVTAYFNKYTGQLFFEGKVANKKLIKEFRKEKDTLLIEKINPLSLDLPGVFILQLLENNSLVGDEIKISRRIHQGIEAKYNYDTPHAPHDESKWTKLNDGLAGVYDFNAEEWIGWKNENANIEITFDEPRKVSKLVMRFADKMEEDIYPPNFIQVSASFDGKEYIEVGRKIVQSGGFPIFEEVIKISAEIMGIRIFIDNYHSENSDFDSWLLMDEISVNKY